MLKSAYKRKVKELTNKSNKKKNNSEEVQELDKQKHSGTSFILAGVVAIILEITFRFM